MNKFPKLCEKTFDTLMQDFSLLSSDFTPEWDFDVSGDDFGVTFAKIFCKMHEDTIEQLNKSVKNIYLTMLNFMGVSSTLCNPSKTVCFVKIDKNSKPRFIKKGTKINAAGKFSNVTFETACDAFVMGNSINSIFMSDFNSEKIAKIYDHNEELIKFKLFDFKNLKNLQKRYIYIYDDNVFDVGSAAFRFKFDNVSLIKDKKQLCDIFVSSKWEFFDGKSWVNVQNVEKSRSDDLILVHVNKKMFKCEIFNKESIYFRVSPAFDCNIKLSEISYISDKILVNPDEIFYGEQILEQSSDCFPFGEKFYLYDTFTIKCNETFKKPGANISISANVNFIKIHSEFKNYVKNYKMIMNDIDFVETEPLDINIERVVWEYYSNGAWRPLKVDNKDSERFFCGNCESGKKFLNFVCPDDISEINTMSYSGLVIRARITKIGNQYSNYFNYISPCLSDLKIEYSYDEPHVCKEIVVYSDLEYKKFNMVNVRKESFEIFKVQKNVNRSLYINLTNTISDGILNIFFEIEDFICKNDTILQWEYFARNNNGDENWKVLHVIDYTKGLSKSGTVRIIGEPDFAKTKFFNKEGYFIRISQVGESEYLPVIKDIQLNSIEIVQKESVPYEYFYVNEYEKNKTCKLASESNNIFDLEVWVDEKASISSSELSEMISQTPGNVEIEKNSDRTNKKVWIKWEKTNNILGAGPSDRVYEFNSQSSKIRFGDGKHGKLPSEVYGKNIRVRYYVSQGENGNIDEMSVSGFNSNIPHVSKVFNKEKSFGGTNIETLSHAATRTFSQVSTGNRLISREGFENGILFNDQKIFRVRCFSHVDKYGNESPGSLTVVILPKDYMSGTKNFSEIRKSAIEFINQNAPMQFCDSNKVFILEALYVKFSLKISARMDDIHIYQEAYDGIASEIKKFLNPISGGQNGNGFQIGALPSRNDIFKKIQSIDDVYVEQLDIFTKILTEQGEKEMLFQDLKKSKFTVPVLDDIDIRIHFKKF